MLKEINFLKLYIVYFLFLKQINVSWIAFNKSLLKGSSEINFQLFCIFFILFVIISSVKVLRAEDFVNSTPAQTKPLTDKYYYKYIIILFLFIGVFFMGKFNKILCFPRIYHFGIQDFMFVFTYAFMILYKPKDKIEPSKA